MPARIGSRGLRVGWHGRHGRTGGGGRGRGRTGRTGGGGRDIIILLINAHIFSKCGSSRKSRPHRRRMASRNPGRLPKHALSGPFHIPPSPRFGGFWPRDHRVSRHSGVYFGQTLRAIHPRHTPQTYAKSTKTPRTPRLFRPPLRLRPPWLRHSRRAWAGRLARPPQLDSTDSTYRRNPLAQPPSRKPDGARRHPSASPGPVAPARQKPSRQNHRKGQSVGQGPQGPSSKTAPEPLTSRLPCAPEPHGTPR